MKRFVFILAAVLAVFSCGRVLEVEMPDQQMPDQVGHDGNKERVVHFRAVHGETRAQFGAEEYGEYPTLWTENDQEVKLSLNYDKAVPTALTSSQDGRSATFEAVFDFTNLTGPFTFYSVSPAAAAQAMSPSREAWKVSIPCEQTPTEGSVDEAGIILAATSYAYPSAEAVDVVDLSFNHLTAYGRISLSNLSLQSGETVQAVEMTMTTPFVGDWYWKCDEGHELQDYGASSTLTLHTSRTSGIWFACAPVDVSEEVMTVTAITNLGNHVQMIEFPANRRFVAGRVATFTVNMDGADFIPAGGSTDFTLVTDASTLQAGDEIIITNVAATYGLGPANTSGSTPYRQAVAVSAEGTVLSNTGTATVLTLRAGNVSGTWALDTGNGYLCTTSTKNSLSTSSSITNASSWSVSIVDGEAAIVAQSGTYNNLRYNESNTRFSGYSSSTTMAKPAIYRRNVGGGVATDPLMEQSEYGCYLGEDLERTLVVGTDQVTRTYNESEIQTYTIIDPDAVEELEISGYKRSYVKGDDLTVTVNWRQGKNTVHSASYSMTVIKEQGPKVWLGNGTGKGFIIKK